MVFANRVLRRIYGAERDKVTREWRKLQNEERNDLYSSPITVRVIEKRRMKWAGHVACMGEKRGVYRVLVRKFEGNRPLR
jgi:cell division protein FtsL